MVDDGITPAPDLVRLAAGDADAFARLYDRLGGRLFAAARRMTGSAEAAEDAVQEVFVELARGRRNLAGVVDLDGYVFTVLRHAVARWWRTSASRRRSLEGLRRVIERAHGPDGRVTPPADLADDRLAGAMAALPGSQREVVALRIDGGLSFAEIADVTGTSTNTATSRYRYAIEKLRVALGAEKIPHGITEHR